LRPDLRFSDGTAITAATFVAGFARLRADDTAAPVSALFDGIARMTAVSGGDVAVTLIRPDPALLTLLAHPALAALPLHRIAAVADRWTAERPLVTSGAYHVTDWRLNERLVLSANPHWHDGRPPIATVEWQPVADKLTALRRYQTGQADIMTDFPAARMDGLRRRLGQQVHVAPTNGTYYFAFNTRRPPFNDRRVRRALSMVIDRPWLTDTLLRAGHRPAGGLLPAGLGLPPFRPVWADLPMARRHEEARKLLIASGYGPDHPLRFTIRFNSDRDHRRVATALAAMWRPLGVEASLFNSEASLHFAAMRRGEFDLARSGWIADVPTPENFLMVHRSNAGPVNYSGYASPAYDLMLADAIASVNPARRNAMMRAAEQQLIEDSPILPIFHYASRTLVAPRVAGWQDNPGNAHPSRTLRLMTGVSTAP
jgi:peptide/nickel transport system substrate-binding protein/oligopeptide transport system substrate-binding protein